MIVVLVVFSVIQYYKGGIKRIKIQFVVIYHGKNYCNNYHNKNSTYVRHFILNCSSVLNGLWLYIKQMKENFILHIHYFHFNKKYSHKFVTSFALYTINC